MIHLLKKSSKPVAAQYSRRLVSIGSTPFEFHSKQKGAKLQERNAGEERKQSRKRKDDEEQKGNDPAELQEDPSHVDAVENAGVMPASMQHNAEMDDGFRNVQD